MRTIKVGVGLIGVAVAAGIAAFGTAGTGEAAPAKPRIGVIIKGLDNPFFITMADGVKAQAKALGVTVTIQEAKDINDTAGQADKLDTLAAQNFDCYVVNPISGTNLVQPMRAIARDGKPIVNIDLPVSKAALAKAGIKIATYVGTNNVSAGALGAKQALKLVPSGSSVALVGGISGDPTSNARLSGFVKGIGSKLKVVQRVAADWDRDKAFTAAENIMRSNSDVKLFFAANDTMALGISQAVRNAGKTGSIKVIGVDGITDSLKSIKAGQQTASVSQYPFTVGAMGVEACVAAAQGKKLPANAPAPILLVTKSNASEALDKFPRPFGSYPDPFRTLVG